MRLFAHRCAGAWVGCALLLAALTAPLQAQDKDKGPPPDPAEVRLRAVLGLNLGFKAYVFDGAAFPDCAFEQPARAEELLGPVAIKATYFDSDLQQVAAAKKPGIYGAVIEVTPKEGISFRRYFTLYRTADQLDGATDLAKLAGIEAAVVQQESQLVASTLKDRPAVEWAKDARAARMLAGLSRQQSGARAARKNADAFAQERQWWVGLKQKLHGVDKIKPFVAPRPSDGVAAPVVRAGTLAEAGMKPDAAEKIDAVLTAWAEADDQAFAVCIVRKGVIVLHKAYGTRDGKPMTLTTKSWMASVTKTMSASLMWMLIDQGLVDLDDPIDKHLPELRGLKIEKSLTIRHLYTHTNGLHKWPAFSDEADDVEERVALYYPRVQIPKEFGYNGMGYTLGGKIIENLTGEAVPLCFQKHLLDPLGCPDTDVLGTHADAVSVPLDMARFGQLLLNKGVYGNQRFFKEETFAKMLPQPLAPLIGPDSKRVFGIGLDGKPERFGHGAASAATFSVDVAEELVVVMTRNNMGKVQDKHNGKFWDAIKNGIDRK